MSELGALGLVSIISPSSKLEIIHRFFGWIPYSLKNSMTKFENFLSIGLISGFQLKFIIGAGSNSEHPSLFWSYLPHLNSESHSVFFFGFLILQGTFFQNFKIFLSWLNRLASGSIVSSSQLVWSTDIGGFEAQILLGSGP